MSLYLDNCVLVPLHVAEPASEMMRGWIAGQDQQLVTSDLAAGEFGSALSRLVRMGRLSLAAAQDIHGDFDQWREADTQPVEHQPIDIRVAARFVRQPEPKLLMPDAIHMATCQRLGLTLVTHDGDLAEMARARGIMVVVPA